MAEVKAPEQGPGEEVKSSWSGRYIGLTLFISLLTGIGGYCLKYIFEGTPKRVISIEEKQSPNLLDLDKEVQGKIVASYKLKDQPGKVLQSYFQYSVRIRNIGNEGVENLPVTVQAEGEKLVLIKTPSITTIPKDLQTAATVKQNATTQPDKDEREISLLNPGEAVELAYVAYSTDRVSKAKFASNVRKKDWIILREGQSGSAKETSFLQKPLSEWRGADFFVMTYFFAVLLGLVLGTMSYFVNRLSWSRRW